MKKIIFIILLMTFAGLLFCDNQTNVFQQKDYFISKSFSLDLKTEDRGPNGE